MKKTHTQADLFIGKETTVRSDGKKVPKKTLGFQFGDKVHLTKDHPDHKEIRNGLVVSIDTRCDDQPYLVMFGEYCEDSLGYPEADMIWPFKKYLRKGWVK